MSVPQIVAGILNISKCSQERAANTENIWRKRRFGETWGMFEDDLGKFGIHQYRQIIAIPVRSPHKNQA